MLSREPLEYLKANRARFVEQLVEYVRFPSVSAQPSHKKDVAACAEWIARHCRALGLSTDLHPTPGNPIVLARTPPPPQPGGAPRPHFLVYGHYDVQPAEPFDLWTTPPFEPAIRGQSLFGRGASDNKGQHFAHLKAIEAFRQTGTELPCDVTFVIEGEEEVGSANLAGFLKQHREELRCDGIIISDNAVPSPKHPSLTYGLRGICSFEVEVQGPSRDLHSGMYGGSLDNPAMVLCQMLAQLRDAKGRVNVSEFYNNVVPLSRFERAQLARIPQSDRAYREFLGVPQLFGEQGFTSTERRTARPTLEINGLTSGYQGAGGKTIVPSWARAKLTCRLVPNQTPEEIFRLVSKQLRKLCPKTVRLKITNGHGGDPYLVSPTSPQAQAALRALRSAFGREPVLTREGGSIPIVNDFKRVLGVETLLLGLALPDDNLHSPNEKFDLAMFARGMDLGVHLWHELAAIERTSPPANSKRKRS